MTTLHGPNGKHSLYCWRSLFTAPSLSNGLHCHPLTLECVYWAVAKQWASYCCMYVCSGNAFTKPLPNNGYTRYNMLHTASDMHTPVNTVRTSWIRPRRWEFLGYLIYYQLLNMGVVRSRYVTQTYQCNYWGVWAAYMVQTASQVSYSLRHHVVGPQKDTTISCDLCSVTLGLLSPLILELQQYWLLLVGYLTTLSVSRLYGVGGIILLMAGK
jgi:hypothetical protein